MEKREINMNLPKLDDLFSSEKERYESSLEKIENISIKDIDNFPNHPFKVIENDELLQMVESIKDKGVIVPVLVRPKENGRYEMVSGHRRKRSAFSRITLKCSTLTRSTTINIDIHMSASWRAGHILTRSTMRRATSAW